jgi:hypothetical protein
LHTDTACITRKSIKVHYFCHPYYGEELEVLSRQVHGGEIYYVVMLFDNTHTLIPSWMTDEGICKSYKLFDRPFCPVDILLDLRNFLDGLG